MEIRFEKRVLVTTNEFLESDQEVEQRRTVRALAERQPERKSRREKWYLRKVEREAQRRVRDQVPEGKIVKEKG